MGCIQLIKVKVRHIEDAWVLIERITGKKMRWMEPISTYSFRYWLGDYIIYFSDELNEVLLENIVDKSQVLITIKDIRKPCKMCKFDEYNGKYKVVDKKVKGL